MKQNMLTIPLAFLIIALGAYFLIPALLVETEEQKEEILVPGPNGEEIISLTWDKQGTCINLEKRNGKWICLDDIEFPVDSDSGSLRNKLEALSQITAEHQIAVPDSFSAYGLDNPFCTITTRTASEEYIYTLGSLVSADSENLIAKDYYLGYCNESVYVVNDSLFYAFTGELNSLIKREDIPSMSALRSVKIEGQGSELDIRYMEDSDEISYTNKYLWFSRYEDEYTALSTESVQKLSNEFINLTWNSCVDYNASAVDLERYKLSDKDAVKVTVGYVSRSADDASQTIAYFELLLGDYVDSYCYARIQGSTMVYLMNADKADTIKFANVENLRANDICQLNWDMVYAIAVTVDGVSCSILKNENGNYVLDGRILDSEAVVNLQRALYNCPANGSVEKNAPAGMPDLTFAFYQDSAYFPEVKLEFFRYDSSNYLANMNGEARLLVKRAKIEEIIQICTDLFGAT